MQTFLPLPDFKQSAAVLDRNRLGQQRREAMWCIKATRHGSSSGWINHPCVKMWIHHRDALKLYYNTILDEWTSRGYRNNLPYARISTHSSIELPPWFDWDPFHASHRSNLLRKNPQHYSRFGWTEPDNLPYIWPSP